MCSIWSLFYDYAIASTVGLVIRERNIYIYPRVAYTAPRYFVLSKFHRDGKIKYFRRKKNEILSAGYFARNVFVKSFVAHDGGKMRVTNLTRLFVLNICRLYWQKRKNTLVNTLNAKRYSYVRFADSVHVVRKHVKTTSFLEQSCLKRNRRSSVSWYAYIFCGPLYNCYVILYVRYARVFDFIINVSTFKWTPTILLLQTER